MLEFIYNECHSDMKYIFSGISPIEIGPLLFDSSVYLYFFFVLYFINVVCEHNIFRVYAVMT